MKKIINSFRLAACAKFHKHSVLAMSVAMAGAMLAMTPARAGPPPGLVLSELSDSALGLMRGKFLTAGQVMYFGVEIVTKWQTASGQKISAAGNLEINLAGNTPQVSFKPTITVEQKATTSVAGNHGTTLVSGGGGLQNVNGVVQNIQVAGASNGVTNTIGLNIKNSPAQPGLQTLPGSPLNASTTTANGSTASVSLGANGLNVAVAVPDQGQAVQRIRTTGMHGGQVLQSVQLGGNSNQIQNMINLNVQMNSGAGLASHAGNVLQALKMMPQGSVF